MTSPKQPLLWAYLNGPGLATVLDGEGIAVVTDDEHPIYAYSDAGIPAYYDPRKEDPMPGFPGWILSDLVPDSPNLEGLTSSLAEDLLLTHGWGTYAWVQDRGNPDIFRVAFLPDPSRPEPLSPDDIDRDYYHQGF